MDGPTYLSGTARYNHLEKLINQEKTVQLLKKMALKRIFELDSVTFYSKIVYIC